MNNSSWSSPKVILALIGMLLIAGVVTVSILRDRIVNNPQWTVTVTGRGEVAYQPDTATVLLGVRIDRAGTAESALTQINAKISAVLDAVGKTGVPAKDIQTQAYSIFPQYDFVNETSVLAGYTADQQISVKLFNVDQGSDLISTVISAATKVGANQVNGVSFDVENKEQLKQQARLAAIQDAKSKAQEMANAAGVGLKDVVGWWENLVYGESPAPYYYDGKGGMGGGSGIPGVSGGEQKIIIDMGVNYRIK